MAHRCDFCARQRAQCISSCLGRLLEERGQGERLEVFNHDKFEDFTHLVTFFSNEVCHLRLHRNTCRFNLSHACLPTSPCVQAHALEV